MSDAKREPWFTAGLRTPFGRAHKGAYVGVRPDDLIVTLLSENRRRNPGLWEEPPEDVLVGCAYPEGEQGYNVGRMAALGTGIPSPGGTYSRLCGSALDAMATAAGRVRGGYGSRFLVGGVESMSRVPRRGANFSESEAIRATCPTAYVNMGDTAEEVARRYPRISRALQEDFSARSHQLAFDAYERGDYATQLAVTEFGGARVSRDEFVRWPADRAKMAELKPAFKEGGTVTAATSSPLSDGATSGWILSAEEARKSGVSNALKILDVTWGHVAPEVMGLGPVPAISQILKRNGLKPSDVAAYEINEAFAIQVLACQQELGLPPSLVNGWGGAIAIGHPLGASGLRLMMTLQGRLEHAGDSGAMGIASLCIGGGQGMAVLCEYVNED
ncbi:MAG TPA: thiolase family protein [Bdellovibrionota bacterium]|jgi:acetyl-CoA acyltransferase|nr:thiolase family protein [Bdellovibrionota bacterium]